MKTLADFSIKAVEIPYRDEPDHRYIEEKLDQLSAEGQIDGIISVGYSSSGIVPPVGKYSEAGIPVALVGNDNEKSTGCAVFKPITGSLERFLGRY